MSLHILKERYVIVRQLAKKAGRKTLLARDLKTNELVVVKLLTFNSEMGWEELKLFEREAKILRNLCFSAIPSYIDFFEVTLLDRKALALVQTYIEADSLEQQVEKKGVFNEEEVKQLAKSILQILVYLQGQNPSVIHRDIKPSNILLTNRSGNNIGDVYLIDFGSVQTLASSESEISTVVGTYGYMAPEQFGGRAVAASDLYGLGATLIYLLTGNFPGDLPSKEGIIEFEKVAGCSGNFSEWLRKMVEPLQENRFQSAVKALKNLENLSSITLSDYSQSFAKKVLIKKSANVIEILTPCQKNLDTSMAHFLGTAYLGIFYGIFSIPFISNLEEIFQSIVVRYSLIHPYSLIALSILVIVLYLYVNIWLKIIINVLFIPFGKNKLKIDKNRIYFTYKLLGLEYRYRKSIPRHAIIKLDSNQDKIPEVIIWLGVHKYSFGKGFLNSNQAIWLSRELSNWLGIK
ncbi:MAG: serine/threonine-protein kinase, partial [Cyanobacteria bacterium P01_D01_bin.116]